MTETGQVLTLYVKKNCPFCLKVRIFLLESGHLADVDIHEFVPGMPDEQAIRSRLEPLLDKVSFPALIDETGKAIADSDMIVDLCVRRFGIDRDDLPTFLNYADGVLPRLIQLFQDNAQLRQRA